MADVRNIAYRELVAVILLLVTVLSAGPVMAASTLTSQFFRNNSSALQVEAGTPYNMNDPAWRDINHNQNRNTFAYKLFAGLLMLGYQTEMDYLHGGQDNQHILALKAFQARNSLGVSNLVDSACLLKMDQQLFQREALLAPLSQTFQLTGHMQPLHPNDISKDALAAIYGLPLAVLPGNLQMSTYELVQCIGGQCVGSIQDAGGSAISSWPTPIDTSSDFRFVGAYFDPLVGNSRLPSAAVHFDTVLHEYAHYLDGFLYKNKDPLQPKLGLIDTRGFFDIAYDLSSGSYCYALKSSDPKDWITKYAAQFNGYGNCASGSSVTAEDWAESFSMYVAAGRDFRAAAQQSAMIAQRYDWLKVNVFNGLEYDTDLPRDLESGCNDVYGTATAQPGYAHCNDNYLWDFSLTLLQTAGLNDTPDPFVFVTRTNAEPGAMTVSDPITVAGLATSSPISISNGEFAINGGSFTASAGWVNNGDSITIRLSSSGTYSATVTAKLLIGGVSGSFSVMTKATPLPTISGIPPTSAAVGSAYSFTPTTTNATRFTITDNAPPGLGFNVYTGTLSGTPFAAGTFSNIVITAVNSSGTAILPPFSIVVLPPLPGISGAPATSVAFGLYYSFTPSATYAVSFQITGTVPPGLVFNSFTGTLYGFPDAAGTFGTIVISAVNSHGSTPLPPFSITVVPPTPTIDGVPAPYAYLGIPYRFMPSANYSDSFTLNGSLPPGLNFDPATGMISGTPTAIGSSGSLILSAVNSNSTMSLPSFSITVTTASGRFTPAVPLTVKRQFHIATQLQNGKVLIAGGFGDYEPLAFAELYDPANDSWSTAASMNEARGEFTAILLNNGKVLVVGGNDVNFSALATAELYDPVSDSWTPAAPMETARIDFTATTLANGMLLVTGGRGTNGTIGTAELYDPILDSWIPAGTLAEARGSHAAVLLPNGKVLVTGGWGDNGSLGSAELYDPNSNSWTSAPPMSVPRYYPSATTLPNGKVLVAGGYDMDFEALESTELYDPITNSWSPGAPMSEARNQHSANMLGNGLLSVTGGYGKNGVLASAELYDPAAGSWSFAGPMVNPRVTHGATLLNDGRLLVTGGLDDVSVLASAEVYMPVYSVTFVAGTNGNISSGSTIQSIGHGDGTSPVTASADSGFHFVNWTGSNGFVTSSENPLTVTGVRASMTITANFAQDPPVAGICGISVGPFKLKDEITSPCSSGTATTIVGSGPWTWSCRGLNNGADSPVCSAAIFEYSLTIANLSSGGTINSDANFFCSISSCSQIFPYGTVIKLYATPDAISLFSGWAGDCSSNGNCQVSMDVDRIVTATYTDHKPFLVNQTEYDSLQSAYAGAPDGAVIKLISGTNINGPLKADQPKIVIISGGYGAAYSPNGGSTVIQGRITLQAGKVIMQNAKIR